MSRAALPGAHAGADASSARGDPSEEETGETVPDGDVDASTPVSRERERDAPSDVGLVAIARTTRAFRFVRAGGRAGSVAVEGAVEDARSRFRAGVVVAVRLRRADDVGVFLLGERGVGARGWEFRAGGWSRGLAGPRRRGRGRAAGGEADGASRGCTRESWIRDSGVAFGRVVAGDGGREDRHGARARVSDGSFPRGCPTAREWTRAERESNGAGREIATPTRARS